MMKLQKATIERIEDFAHTHGKRCLSASVQVDNTETPALFSVHLEIGEYDHIHTWKTSAAEMLLETISDAHAIKTYLAVRKHIRKIRAETRL